MATFKRLHELGEDVVRQVDDMLLGGEKPAKVAQWLHEDLEVLTDLKLSSLKKNLERYRSQDLRGRMVEGITALAVGKSAAGLKRQFIALEELTDLAKIQKGRLHSILMKEGQLPKGILLKQASDEARSLKEMLVELGKMQLETGIMRRAPKHGTIESMDPSTGVVREFRWSEQQETLLQEIDDLGFIDGELVDVEEAEEVQDR